jgi:hypothetical protein
MSAPAGPGFHQQALALLALTAVSTAIGFTMKASQVAGTYTYSPMSAIAMMELYKLVTSLIIIGKLIQQQRAEKSTTVAQEVRSFFDENFSMPLLAHEAGLALAYAVVNIVTFGVLAMAPASTFFLLKAASPVVTALMLMLLVHRVIAPVQWASVVMQCVGLLATQFNPCSGGTNVSGTAYLYIFINIIVSCAAGVWNESVIKQYKTSVNAQNVMLYGCGTVLNVVLFTVLPAELIGAKGGLKFFEGYNMAVFAVIMANGSVGLVITAVYKYADVVVKTFGLAGSTVVLFMMEALRLIPNSSPKVMTMPNALGIVLVFYAAYAYIMPKPAVKEETEGDGDAAVVPPTPTFVHSVKNDPRATVLVVLGAVTTIAIVAMQPTCNPN